MSVELTANLTSLGADPREFAAAAEAAGFAGVSCSDHFWRRDAYPHLWVTLTAMALATERVTVSASFANNLLRSPVEFAQASLTLHRLSGGRTEAGLGAGWLAAEVVGSGLPYPSPRDRARRYREAVLVARDLLRTGTCRFTGEHYAVDVPVLGPLSDPPPPLVASVGGPWTIRHVAPLVDRVELKFGRTTRAGDLDVAALASTTRDELAGMVDAVREVAPTTPIGTFAMVAVGDGPEVEHYRHTFGDSFSGGFVGEPARVLDHLHGLAAIGIDRVQVSELVKGSALRLLGGG